MASPSLANSENHPCRPAFAKNLGQFSTKFPQALSPALSVLSSTAPSVSPLLLTSWRGHVSFAARCGFGTHHAPRPMALAQCLSHLPARWAVRPRGNSVHLSHRQLASHIQCAVYGSAVLRARGRAFQYPSFCRDLLGKTGADKGRGMPFADPVDPQPATGVSVLESSLLHLSSLTNLRRYRHVGAPLQPNIRERKLRPTKTNAEHYPL